MKNTHWDFSISHLLKDTPYGWLVIAYEVGIVVDKVAVP